MTPANQGPSAVKLAAPTPAPSRSLPTRNLPLLTCAQAPLTQEITCTDETGALQTISIPAERALTVYVDKRELVTLMTLGAHPEWLVLGFLRNQRLINSAAQVKSVTVDWDVGAAAVATHGGIANLDQRTSKKVVTTGCGQGSMFGDLMADLDAIALPPATLTQTQLVGLVNAIRLKESTYKSAGSVHACALFQGADLLMFVEDVGRHNAIDTIAGWMALQTTTPEQRSSNGAGDGDGDGDGDGNGNGESIPVMSARDDGMSGHDKVFYTTGRLTSEMVIKSAQMGVPIVVSRSGITQMGLQIAKQLGLCAIGRATNKRFLCFSAPQRLVMDVP